MGIKWYPERGAAGDILRSKCGRFHVITGNLNYTLLDKGVPVERGPREDLLKIRAAEIAEQEKRA